MRILQMIGDPGASYFVNGNTYQGDGAGFINSFKNGAGTFTGIAQGDTVSLLNAGAKIAQLRTRTYDADIVLAASAAVIVASVALTNGALTVAAQPDVPRQLQTVVNPGVSAITAGSQVLVYNDSDGVATTDTLSLVVALSTALTLTTTRGVAHLTSATVTGLVGGTSPNIQTGTNTVLALPAEQGKANLVVFKANMDNIDVAVGTQSGAQKDLITPGTAPNGTHTYTFGYQFYS